jgi:hypothetical protein
MKKHFLNIDEFKTAVIVFNIEIDKLNEKYKSTISSILLLGEPIVHLSKAINLKLNNATGFAELEMLTNINNTELKNEIISKAKSIFDL